MHDPVYSLQPSWYGIHPTNLDKFLPWVFCLLFKLAIMCNFSKKLPGK
uniref:Uncharacterized protein n=1 Tax=Arundo donax TaxID=35708 RepID=A0A0A9GBJ3_ARUDO